MKTKNSQKNKPITTSDRPSKSPNDQAQSPIHTDAFHRLLGFADAEWKGIIRFGRHCGLNLFDCARLNFTNLSHDRRMLLLNVANMKHLLRMPLGPKLTDYLMTLPIAATPETPIFPNCKSMDRRGLEMGFNRLMGQAGLDRSRHKFSSLHFDFGGLQRRR